MSLEDMFSFSAAAPDASIFGSGKSQTKGKGKRKQPKGASVKKQEEWASFSRAKQWDLRSKHPDSDMDGIPDKWDCEPLNPLRQDTYSPKELEEIQSLGKVFAGEFISHGFFGSVFRVKAEDPSKQHIADKYVVKVSNTARRFRDDPEELDLSNKKREKIKKYGEVYKKRHGTYPTLEHIYRKFKLRDWQEFPVHKETKDYKQKGYEDLKFMVPMKATTVHFDDVNVRTVGMLKPFMTVVAEHGIKESKKQHLTPEVMEQIRQGTDEFTRAGLHFWDSYQVGVYTDAEGKVKARIFDTDVVAKAEDRPNDFFGNIKTTADRNKKAWDDFVSEAENRGIKVTNKKLDTWKPIDEREEGPANNMHKEGWKEVGTDLKSGHVEYHKFYKDGTAIGTLRLSKNEHGRPYIQVRRFGGVLREWAPHDDGLSVGVTQMKRLYEQLLTKDIDAASRQLFTLIQNPSAINDVLSEKRTSSATESSQSKPERRDGWVEAAKPQYGYAEAARNYDYYEKGNQAGWAMLAKGANGALFITVNQKGAPILRWTPKDKALNRDLKKMEQIFTRAVLNISLSESMKLIESAQKDEQAFLEKLNLRETGWHDLGAGQPGKGFDDFIAAKAFYQGGERKMEAGVWPETGGALALGVRAPADDALEIWRGNSDAQSLVHSPGRMKNLFEQLVAGDATDAMEGMRHFKKKQDEGRGLKALFFDEKNEGGPFGPRNEANAPDLEWKPINNATDQEKDAILGYAYTAKKGGLVKGTAYLLKIGASYKIVIYDNDAGRRYEIPFLQEPANAGSMGDRVAIAGFETIVLKRTLEEARHHFMSGSRSAKKPEPKGEWRTVEESQLPQAFLAKKNWYEGGKHKGFIALGKGMDSNLEIDVVRRADSRNPEFIDYWYPAADRNNVDARRADLEILARADMSQAVADLKLLKKEKQKNEPPAGAFGWQDAPQYPGVEKFNLKEKRFLDARGNQLGMANLGKHEGDYAIFAKAGTEAVMWKGKGSMGKDKNLMQAAFYAALYGAGPQVALRNVKHLKENNEREHLETAKPKQGWKDLSFEDEADVARKGFFVNDELRGEAFMRKLANDEHFIGALRKPRNATAGNFIVGNIEGFRPGGPVGKNPAAMQGVFEGLLGTDIDGVLDKLAEFKRKNKGSGTDNYKYGSEHVPSVIETMGGSQVALGPASSSRKSRRRSGTSTQQMSAGWVAKGNSSYEYVDAGKALGKIWLQGLEVMVHDYKTNKQYTTGEWVSKSEASFELQDMLLSTFPGLMANKKKHELTEVNGKKVV